MRSHGTPANSRAWAASRSARYSRTSSSGSPRPSPKACTLAGTRAALPPGSSGSPTSPPPSTSPASAADRLADLGTEQPAAIRRSIGAAPAEQRRCISGGACAAIASRHRRADPSARPARPRSARSGKVCSIHSARLQASLRAVAAASSQQRSSHRSAVRSASATCRCSASETLGSPSPAAACRAIWRARSQFTGLSPPPPEISCWTWPSSCCSSLRIGRQARHPGQTGWQRRDAAGGRATAAEGPEEGPEHVLQRVLPGAGPVLVIRVVRAADAALRSVAHGLRTSRQSRSVVSHR